MKLSTVIPRCESCKHYNDGSCHYSPPDNEPEMESIYSTRPPDRFRNVNPDDHCSFHEPHPTIDDMIIEILNVCKAKHMPQSMITPILEAAEVAMEASTETLIELSNEIQRIKCEKEHKHSFFPLRKKAQ